MKLKHICAIFGGTCRITAPLFHIFFGGGRVPLSPAGFTPLLIIFILAVSFFITQKQSSYDDCNFITHVIL